MHCKNDLGLGRPTIPIPAGPISGFGTSLATRAKFTAVFEVGNGIRPGTSFREFRFVQIIKTVPAGISELTAALTKLMSPSWAWAKCRRADDNELQGRQQARQTN